MTGLPPPRPLTMHGPVDHLVYVHCLAHRRPVRWLPAPLWWFHAHNQQTCTGMVETREPRRPQ